MLDQIKKNVLPTSLFFNNMNFYFQNNKQHLRTCNIGYSNQCTAIIKKTILKKIEI